MHQSNPTTMKTQILFIIILIMAKTIFAQEFKQNIRGRITDSQSKTPLFGATIILMNSDPLIGVISDMDGNFVIENVAVGRQSVKFSYIGYEERNISNILVVSGKEPMLDIELREMVTSLDEVKVVARKHEAPLNTMAGISARQFSVEETKRYAGGFNDPSRMASSFAGVASLDGESNEIIIRGNSPRGMLWKLEGIEIPNPNHFRDGEGASGGAISIITSSVMSNSDFYTGAFPAEYGNAYSGVFDINLRKGNPCRREYAVQLGITGAEGSFEGPFKKNSRSTYLINYRYSILTALEKLHINIGDNDITPRFQDLTFNLNFMTRKAGYLSVFGLGGNSSAGDVALKDSLYWIYWSDKYYENEYHRMGLAGLKHMYPFPDQKTYIKTVALISNEYNSVIADTLGHGYISGRVQNDRFNYPAFRMSTLVNHKFNARNTVRSGLNFSYLWFDMFAEGMNWDKRAYERWISQNGSSFVVEGYTQWQNRLNSKLEMNSGIHYTYFGLNGNQSIEPRFGIIWSFLPGKSLSYGFGLHSRVEALSVYFTKVPSLDVIDSMTNKNLGLTKAMHHVVGFDWNVNENLRLKIETYYQYLYHVPQPVDPTSKLSGVNHMNGLVTIELDNKGTAYNYGVEFTLEKFYSAHYFYLITASLFESKYKAPDGQIYNSVFNSNYILNLLGGKEFKINDKSTLTVNTKLIAKGGNRITPIDLEQSIIEGDEHYVEDKYLKDKAPDFIRWDAGITYRKNKKNYSWELSLDIQNLTNRKNIFTSFYDDDKEMIDYRYFPGLIPVINYRIVF